MRKLLLALTGIALSAASPALADVVDSGTPEKSVYDGDFLIVEARPTAATGLKLICAEFVAWSSVPASLVAGPGG